MSGQILLRGITWNHSRALPPLVATAQRFEELHPEVKIIWEKRSLHDFGHAHLVPLAQEFDLLIVDHPMMGLAHRSEVLRDLQHLLPRSSLDDLERNSVGQSYKSYRYEGRLFALPIDAAAPVASSRPDLLRRAGFEVPQAWHEVLRLKRSGLVIMPGFHADLFLNFMALCVSFGASLCEDPERFVDRKIGAQCLEQLRQLAVGMPDEIYSWNPIAIYEIMACSDTFAYCPFAYSYSNYAREGFGQNVITFNDPPSLQDKQPLQTVLGGTGVAISKQCTHRETALEYAAYVSGEQCQRTIYALSGGQPAHRAAWLDNTLNLVTHDFFRRTLGSLDRAYLRPRYPGYIELQAQAGIPIQSYFRNGGNSLSVLEQIDDLYRRSKTESLGSLHHA